MSLTEWEIDLLLGTERASGGLVGAQDGQGVELTLRARHFLAGGEPLPGLATSPPRRAGLLPRTTVTIERM